MYEELDTFLHKLSNPMSLSAVIGDTMYLHKALAQPDRQEFIKAMVKEITTHKEQKSWIVTPIEEVPKGTKVLDSIWLMRRKRKIGTGKISKYKARLMPMEGNRSMGYITGRLSRQ